MGFGMHEKNEDENPSESETEPEEKRLNEPETMEMKHITRDAENPRVLVIGEEKPLFKTSHLKYSLLIFNCILAILGLIILILAIWIRVDPEFWDYETTLDVSNFYTVCYLFIIAGIILVLVSFLGCLGVITESQGMLITYFVIFVGIFILELAAVIIVWSSPYSKTIKSTVEKEIQNQINQMGTDASSRYFVDFIQEHLECCGAVNQDDYKNDIPKSCKNPTTGNILTEGCASSFLRYLRSKGGIIGGIAFPILLIQLLAKMVCFCLIQNIKNESRYTMRD